ncbi:zinc ABC transporter substrate-binding protein [Caldibacillus lycopersici]|uniref:Zinc ABC transporter substrate-binding protein n=1 Tax=Perspicuibacillus lycopersici TaxID=1325689 RepID=A0AAE3IWQ6_9BACI|nr:zinc ABC transporter substrate-binding protein [Perspicuibacillus lycopersici]MCU9614294.1 zinc ABC transporter substrate-binding protein [Perspicuibacillus lycopersici]
MVKYKLFFTIFLIAIVTFLSACGNDNDSLKNKADGKLKIYTTVYPLKDFAEKIGGEYVDVETIYPPGMDEHTFEPSQKDIINMAGGDIFFYIGYGLEGFVEKTKPILQDEGVNVVATGEFVQLPEVTHEEEQDEEEGHDEHNHGTVNPHIWLDPVYAKQLAEVIKDTLIEAIPEQKQYFEDNYATVAKQLDMLNDEFVEVTKNMKTNHIIVTHAAYGYWELRYGIEQLSISGMSSTDEPSQKQLQHIIEEVQEQNLNYILVEQNINNKLIDVVKKEANVTPLPIHNLSVLTEKDIENNADYFSIMEQNLNTLKQALNN